MRTDPTRQATDPDLTPEEMREPVRTYHAEEIRAGIDRALDRIADHPPLLTQRTKLRLLAAAVTTAAVLLALNVAGTANDLTGHDHPAKPPITITTTVPAPGPGEYIPTPAGPPVDQP